MAEIIIKIDDKIIENFFAQVATAGTGGEPSKEEKPSKSSRSSKSESGAGNAEKMKEACSQLLEVTDKNTVKEVISEFGAKTVAAASKLTGDDYDECLEAVNEAIEEAAEGSEDDAGGEEITVDAVKKAVQAYSRKNGKEETTEILEDFGISSVRSLHKLEQEDLEELYAEVMA